MTMRVHEYALMRDIAAAQQRPRAPQTLWAAPPLLVMNNFAGPGHLKLATVLFQNLFPTLNVTTVRLASCQVRNWKGCAYDLGSLDLEIGSEPGSRRSISPPYAAPAAR